MEAFETAANPATVFCATHQACFSGMKPERVFLNIAIWTKVKIYLFHEQIHKIFIMAEAIGVVAASLEVGKAIIQAREKLQAIKSAPDEIRATLDDASRLSKLLTFLSRQQSRLSTNVQPIEELDAMNNLCQEAADDLLQYAKELNAEIQRAKWQGSFKIILKRKAIDQRKKTLESAKTSLGLAQQAFTQYAKSY